MNKIYLIVISLFIISGFSCEDMQLVEYCELKFTNSSNETVEIKIINSSNDELIKTSVTSDQTSTVFPVPTGSHEFYYSNSTLTDERAQFSNLNYKYNFITNGSYTLTLNDLFIVSVVDK